MRRANSPTEPQLRGRRIVPHALFLLHGGREAGKEVFQQDGDSVFRRPKFAWNDSQRLGQTKQFKIGNPTQLRFDFGEGLAAEIPAPPAAPGREHGLGQALLAPQPADLRPNDVPRIAHVPKSELERRKGHAGQGSEFRTDCACTAGMPLPEKVRRAGKRFH